MITSNPFDALTALISTDIMQGYVILMAILVFMGTVLDMMHKKSAKYFFQNAEKAKKSAKRSVGAGEKAGLAVATLANEVLTSGEFSNPKRRLSHLLTMYGTIIFIVTSALMIFECDSIATSTLAQLWHIGAIMLAVGGYWFWFFIRVDVNSEGVKWYQLRKADMFIVSLLLMATFGLIWSYMQSNGGNVADMGSTALFFGLFILSTTFLFSTVMWSKFAHMFFKPAAAFQKRVAHADGSNENLPADYDPSDPAVHARFPDIPMYMGKNPPNMGAGIRREPANHY
ncbi:MAG: adenylyl-sulfate reductase [Gammaproteobacteria bacterium]|nr:adenylyl-sulfate reductase [Gammaproteobacteria bacterium]MDH5594415.1 adenylyl-sulfate reductase [Gammaproteobacteria bacterium]